MSSEATDTPSDLNKSVLNETKIEINSLEEAKKESLPTKTTNETANEAPMNNKAPEIKTAQVEETSNKVVEKNVKISDTNKKKKPKAVKNLFSSLKRSKSEKIKNESKKTSNQKEKSKKSSKKTISKKKKKDKKSNEENQQINTRDLLDASVITARNIAFSDNAENKIEEQKKLINDATNLVRIKSSSTFRPLTPQNSIANVNEPKDIEPNIFQTLPNNQKDVNIDDICEKIFDKSKNTKKSPSEKSFFSNKQPTDRKDSGKKNAQINDSDEIAENLNERRAKKERRRFCILMIILAISSLIFVISLIIFIALISYYFGNTVKLSEGQNCLGDYQCDSTNNLRCVNNVCSLIQK